MVKNKAVIIAIDRINLDSWEAAKCVNKFLHELVAHHCNDVCDAYNISKSAVSVNFRLIEDIPTDSFENTDALIYVDVDSFSSVIKDFIEEGLLSCRIGHVDKTADIVINYNICFVSGGSIIVTQESFAI